MCALMGENVKARNVKGEKDEWSPSQNLVKWVGIVQKYMSCSTVPNVTEARVREIYTYIHASSLGALRFEILWSENPNSKWANGKRNPHKNVYYLAASISALWFLVCTRCFRGEILWNLFGCSGKQWLPHFLPRIINLLHEPLGPEIQVCRVNMGAFGLVL